MPPASLHGQGAHYGQPCLHCRQPCKARRRRGLCRRCHGTPATRQSYPLLGPAGPVPRPFAAALAAPPTPPTPTDAEPGSQRKISEMAARVTSGNGVFHPEDTILPPHLAGDGSRRRLNQKLGELAEALAASTLDRAGKAVG